MSMQVELGVPTEFADEKAETDWLEHNRSRLDAYVAKKLDEQIAARSPKSKSITISLRLNEEDIARARKIAGAMGIGYQTAIKILLRDALKRAEVLGTSL